MKKILWTLTLTSVMLGACNDDDVGINETDRSFLINAGYVNHAEIDAGQLASTKSSIEGVQMFGAMMATEHTQALIELESLTNNKQVTLPAAPDPAHQQLKKHLMSFSGYSFDSAYMRSQIADHQNAITLFESEISEGDDQQARDYAMKYLPHIRMHLQKADSIYNVMAHP